MPVLTPHLFNTAVDDVWAKAQADFAKDHFVYGHLIGVSRQVAMCHFAQAGTIEDANRLTNSGITPIPTGPWHSHALMIEQGLRSHDAVAAIWVGEAWTTSDRAGLESLTGGPAPSEHPLRDEFVYVYATWPRARIHRLHAMRIERGKKVGDTPRLEPFPPDSPLGATLNSETVSEGSGARPDEHVVIFGWVNDLLPQPPKAK